MSSDKHTTNYMRSSYTHSGRGGRDSARGRGRGRGRGGRGHSYSDRVHQHNDELKLDDMSPTEILIQNKVISQVKQLRVSGESDDESSEKYMAPRDDSFKNLIVSLLKRGRLNDKYIEQMLDMDMYGVAFTHKSVNEVKNYEFYEMMGDATANCAIAWYLNKCFPHLHKPEGVKVIARLKINYVSKKTFEKIGKHLGLWDFISADEETRSNKMKQTLEDVFEAFLGVTCTLIDNRVKEGAGFKICYNIIKSVYDEVIQPISLKYEDLFDPKTRLKETFDYPPFQDKLSDLKFESTRNVEERMVYTNITAYTPDGYKIIGKGTGALKATAEEYASKNALFKLGLLSK